MKCLFGFGGKFCIFASFWDTETEAQRAAPLQRQDATGSIPIGSGQFPRATTSGESAEAKSGHGMPFPYKMVRGS